jgi:DNA-binding transcriptional LysR family regulator
MQVELRLMRYVVTVAEEGGFQAAARRLRIAQPPLSRQIRALEQQLGAPLFHRRPTRLTETGQEFVRAARRALAAADEVVEAARRAAARQQTMVRVGYGPTTAYDEMPRIRAAIALSHPGVDVRAEETWGAAMEASMRHGRLDAALGRHLTAPPGYRITVLARHRYMVGVGAAHPAARRKQVQLADLHGQPLRLFPRHLDPAYYDAVVSAATSTGTSFEVWENPVPDLRNIRTRRSMAGFMLVPAPLATYLPGIAALPVSEELPPCELQLAWRIAPGENAEALGALITCAVSALSSRPAGAREH